MEVTLSCCTRPGGRGPPRVEPPLRPRRGAPCGLHRGPPHPSDRPPARPLARTPCPWAGWAGTPQVQLTLRSSWLGAPLPATVAEATAPQLSAPSPGRCLGARIAPSRRPAPAAAATAAPHPPSPRDVPRSQPQPPLLMKYSMRASFLVLFHVRAARPMGSRDIYTNISALPHARGISPGGRRPLGCGGASTVCMPTLQP